MNASKTYKNKMKKKKANKIIMKCNSSHVLSSHIFFYLFSYIKKLKYNVLVGWLYIYCICS